MCTASWLQERDAFQLLFNRDEKRTRLRAGPPCVESRDGVLTIAPVDGDHGGSWISVNERGLALCLLNGDGGTRGVHSRGLLLCGLAGARTMEEAIERLVASDLQDYAAFTLAALEPDRNATIAEWNGAVLAITEDYGAAMPLTSSSFDAEGVCLRRREEFGRITGGERRDAARLFQFHESHGAHADAYSPCMHRPDAETVSFSWVKVSTREVSFFYSPAAPCRWEPGQSISLPRTS